ncbi:MAG: serine/threonine-protein phosphatase [Gammaproteobacteria bacterium]|nr:serine/threonine-protein phosphatase [Gammaproteobacteria bacterium]
MQIEIASLSLIGHRDENQDRLATRERDNAVFAAVVDGMGGHHGGARAAEIATAVMMDMFEQIDLPVFHPREFLSQCIESAHGAVVQLGASLPLDARPRATCAVALVQNDKAYWAHVGDSRVYHLRGRRVQSRTRDHSHIEILLREGLIREDEYREHPLRNYVEHCIGGEPREPTISIAGAKSMERGDVLLLCTDGLWGGADDDVIAACFPSGFADLDLGSNLRELMETAIEAEAPHGDNTSAIVIHWLGE